MEENTEHSPSRSKSLQVARILRLIKAENNNYRGVRVQRVIILFTLPMHSSEVHRSSAEPAAIKIHARGPSARHP